MSALFDLVLGNWLPIIVAAAAAFFGGKVYLKGRQHARAKSDKELQDAIEDIHKDTQAARDAGDRPDAGGLHDDDGFRRD